MGSVSGSEEDQKKTRSQFNFTETPPPPQNNQDGAPKVEVAVTQKEKPKVVSSLSTDPLESPRKPDSTSSPQYTSNFVQPQYVQGPPSEGAGFPDIGDVISVPVKGVTGEYLPFIFYHTGVYIGNGKVISKYLKNPNSLVEGDGVIALENIDSASWRGWTKLYSGGDEAAEKANLFYLGYLNKSSESYHLKSSNCQTFTESCLARGIGSKLYSNLQPHRGQE